VPGRRAELGPLKRGVPFALLLWVLLAARAAGQAPGPPRGRLSAAADLSVTRLSGEWIRQTGAALVLHVSPRIQVAGVARVGLDHPTVREQGDVQVRFGYGGVRIAVQPAPERAPGFVLSFLGGAGNVDVREPTIGSIVDSENGGVVEPGVSFTHPIARRLGVLASASWRFAFEFDAVVGVDSAELGGPAIGIGLSFGPF
jgi:hypothetical protein